jgi:hypothetical protein
MRPRLRDVDVRMLQRGAVGQPAGGGPGPGGATRGRAHPRPAGPARRQFRGRTHCSGN